MSRLAWVAYCTLLICYQDRVSGWPGEKTFGAGSRDGGAIHSNRTSPKA